MTHKGSVLSLFKKGPRNCKEKRRKIEIPRHLIDKSSLSGGVAGKRWTQSRVSINKAIKTLLWKMGTEKEHGIR